MKQATKQNLMHRAMEALNAEPLASMARIAEKTQVSRMTLFRAFKNRPGLIEALTLESYKECREIINRISTGPGTAFEKLEQSLKEMIPLGTVFRFLLYSPYLSDSPTLNESEIALRRQWRSLLTQMQKEKILREDLSPDWMARCLDNLLIAAWAAIDDGDLAKNTAHDQILTIFLQGTSPQKR